MQTFGACVGAWGATAPGQSRRANEDSYLCECAAGNRTVLLAAVADGMGGHLAGEVASRMALDALLEHLGPFHDDGNGLDIGAVLYAATEHANRSVLRAANSRDEWTGMGTTLTAVIAEGLCFSVCHVGDSRAYWYSRHFSDLVVLTRDHSLAEESLGEDTPTPSAVLTRALGVAEGIDIDHAHGMAKCGDRLLLCTDGISRVLNRSDILQMMESVPAEELPDALVRLAQDRDSSDDATAVLVTWSCPEEENVGDR